MCLEVVPRVKQISRDKVLWVEGSIILLKEGVCRAIARNLCSPLWPSLPTLLGEAWGTGALASYGITKTSFAESQFSLL